MHIINEMPEYIKEKFRLSDCTHCRGYDCRACMSYTFESVDYKQCHFITIALNNIEELLIIFGLLIMMK
jgi:hypothetical protein